LLTPRAVERLRPAIQRIVDDTIAAAVTRERFDIVADFADLIPVRVISSMLNIPEEHHPTFQRLADATIKQVFPNLVPREEREPLFADIREGFLMVGSVIDERRKSPMEGDMLTDLIHVEEQGDRVSREELLSLVAALLIAGSETTVHLIAFTLYNVLRRPELKAQLLEEPDLLKGVIEEVLRQDNFGKFGISRYALEDVEYAGARIKKGEMVILMLGAALRDPAVFADADQFDPRREQPSSLFFGHGAHFCLGASLARLEGQIAVGTFLRRFPEARLEGTAVFGAHPAIRKMESLKVDLRPAPST
jgi:cytochrome P450 enzyme